MTTTAATAISAAIRPYSIAVTPLWSFIRRRTIELFAPFPSTKPGKNDTHPISISDVQVGSPISSRLYYRVANFSDLSFAFLGKDHAGHSPPQEIGPAISLTGVVSVG